MLCKGKAYVAYIKEGDGVAEMLAMMGANSAILQMENARIVRQMRNKANRAMNCDTANINKTMVRSSQTAGLYSVSSKGKQVSIVEPGRCGWQRKRAWRIRKQR